MTISDKTFNVLAKTMGVMALGAVSIDTCHMAKNKANEYTKEGEANDSLRNYLGTSRMDFPSPMYSKIKEKNALKYPHRLMNFLHGTKGFLSGIYEGIVNHADVIGASIFVLCTKKENKIGRLVSTLALGAICAYNYIKNGTILMERRNDFEEM